MTVGASLGVNLLELGSIEEARSCSEEALALAEEVEDGQAIVGALTALARVLAADGQPERARENLAQGIEILRKLGDRLSEGWMTNLDGDLARQMGDLAGARSRFESALELFRELEDPRGIADSLQELGTVARLESRAEESVDHYRESLELFRSLGHRRGLSRVFEGFACLAASRGEAARTLRLAGAAAGLQHQLSSSVRSTDKGALEAELETCRRELGLAANDEWLAGWSMPLDEAISAALGE